MTVGRNGNWFGDGIVEEVDPPANRTNRVYVSRTNFRAGID
jgi:hypothetical protein